MKRQISGILTVLAIFLVIGGTVWYSRTPSHHKGRTGAALPQLKLIDTALPRRQDFPVLCRWFGKVESKKKVSIITIEAGQVISVDSPDEAMVKKGALLFTLGGARRNRRLRAMRGKIMALKRRFALGEERVAMKQKEVAEKIATRDELIAAKDTLDLLRSQLAVAKQELLAFQDTIHIRAPIGGVLTGRRVSVGQEVEKGAVLAEVLVPKQVRVVAYLFPPADAPLKGKKAVIHERESGSISGIVVEVLPRHTAVGATVVWIEGKALDSQLAPGETVNGEITLSIHKGALAVPASAVVWDENERAYVFLKRINGYHRQAVRTGLTSAGWIEVSSGVKEGDKVVARGAYELFYRDFNKIYRVAD